MSDYKPAGTSCPQSRRANEDGRRTNQDHIGWCARTIGAMTVLTSLSSVVASVTITSMQTNSMVTSTQARLDVMRADLNGLSEQMDRALRYRVWAHE